MVKKRVSGPSNPVHIVYDGLEAFREGNGVTRRINDFTPGFVVATIITQAVYPGFIYNIPLNMRFMLAYVWVGVMNPSEYCQFEFGWTDAIDGGGNFMPLSPVLHVATPASLDGLLDKFVPLHIPAPIKYTNGARSVTARIQPNAVTTRVTFGYAGWVEPDV